MKSFGAAYAAECAKMGARKKYFVFLCIGAGICILWAFLGKLIAGAIMNVSGAFSINLTPSPMGILGFFLRVLLPFLIFMAATDLFTVEGAENTMKAMLVLPVERWKLFTAKILAVMSYVALYLLVIFSFSAVFQGLFGGISSFKSLVLAFVSYVIVLIPLSVLCCFAVVMTLLFRGGTLAMFVLLICYLALTVLPVLFTALHNLLFTSYLGMYNLFVGAIPPFMQIAGILLIVFGYGAVFFIGGSLMFDRKEY